MGRAQANNILCFDALLSLTEFAHLFTLCPEKITATATNGRRLMLFSLRVEGLVCSGHQDAEAIHITPSPYVKYQNLSR
jgi:hypothetical protein